ncbi:MAG TPA: 3-hydroxyacyl-CoA dehydrogenase family protein [Hanamia sp.]|nr:3-hydroxyacyl-CoA dehydrogenase family protein [Hanamia sp.]
MRIFISANEVQRKELETIRVNDSDELIFNLELPDVEGHKNYDAYFILSASLPSLDFRQFGSKPVFINAVTETLTELNLPENVSRLNAWPGFLQNKIWEVASNNQKNIGIVFNTINHDFMVVKDEPGLVAARVISMIINEAFYALGEKVSTKEEIDLAMKLGTNYPWGPFEWAEKIGINNIYHLLEKLSEKNDRYLPAPALKKIFSEKK